MKKTIIFTIILSLMTFCAVFAIEKKTYPDIDSSMLMKPQPGDPDTLIFKKEGTDPKKYFKFLFDPVEIYEGKDADFGSISAKEKREVADFLRSEFVRVLDGKYPVVTEPGPNVLRIKLILAGVETTRPAMAVATRIIPFGLAMNLGKSAAGMKGSFTGTVTCAGEFYDAETNTLVVSFLTKRGPNAMDITAVLTGLDAAKTAITDLAEKFVENVDIVQGAIKK